ncbi:MAG TPA: Mth938-like domain-containing protein [Roseiarcus sp.]|nr:Mth938-like domain-containing protein [Roseiarcus sp.]
MMAETGPAAFAPGGHAIVAHGGGAFAFAGMSHHGSILATPKGVRGIEAPTVSHLDERTLAPLFGELREAPGSIEFLVIGSGAQMTPVPKPLRAALREAGLRFEAMATGPALRVYNVMQSEDRRVAAALIATP